MDNLSLVIKEESAEKIYKYVDMLYPLLSDNKTQLIIINNQIDRFNIEFDYTVYEYVEGYSNFKNFCFSVSTNENIIILESGIELGNDITSIIKDNLKKSNYKARFKRYLNKDRNKYYVSNDILIYNLDSQATSDLDIEIEDNRFIDFTEKNIDEKIYKFIEDKRIDELHIWYSVNVLNSDFKIKFYEELEKHKLNLTKELISEIEDNFINKSLDYKYIQFLELKRLYYYNSSNSKEEIKKIIEDNIFDDEYKYFSYFILYVFLENKNVIDVLKHVETNYFKKIMNYLFKQYDKFYILIYNFITSVDLEKELNIPNNYNALMYTEIIKMYMKNMSDKSAEITKKRMLIQMLLEYTNYGIYIISNKLNDIYVISHEELSYLINIDKAIALINKNNLSDAINFLKEAAEQYDVMTMATRYYIQKLIYENKLYSHKLSICMIVKDEEKNIERCLKSLTPLINSCIAEVIVVDTGSTDKTVDIASKYTENIYFHPWQGSFSEARNHSISLARGEYIFIVDADNEIEVNEVNKYMKYFKGEDYSKFNTFTSKIKNFDDEYHIKFSLMTQTHIFKNEESFYYSGTVHNQPQYKEPTKNLDTIMLHYGYIMTDDIKDKKFIRTATLLKKELQKHPENVYYRYQLSVSYSMHGEPKKALDEVKIYMNILKHKNILSGPNLMYYNNAGLIHYVNNLYDESIKIFEKILEEKSDFIDAVYFKASCLFAKEKYEAAKKEFEKYLGLLRNVYNESSINNNCLIFYSLDSKNEALCKLLICAEQLQEYNDFINLLNEIDDKGILKKCFYVAIKGYIYLDQYNEMAKFYKEKVFSCMSNEDRYIFIYLIQKEFSNLDKFDKNKCIIAFDKLDINDEYLNLLKLNFTDNESNYEFFKFVSKLNIKDIDIITAKMVIDTSLPIIKSYKLNAPNKEEELITLKKCIKLILDRTLVFKQFKGLSRSELMELIDKYIQVLSNLNLTNNPNLLLQNEKSFIDNISLAFDSINNQDILSSVRYIKEAVTYDNEMARPMELYLEKIIPKYKSSITVDEEDENTNEFNVNKKKVKVQIEKLILDGDLISAKSIIKEYEKIDNKDMDIYSMKSIIFINEGKLDEAEEVIRKGLDIDSNKFDLLYNLAYLYELKQTFNNAIEMYLKAKDNCTDKSLCADIENTILRIQKEYDIVLKTARKKIAFFVKQGLDSFLDDIINELSGEYETKKIIVTNYNQIDEGMEWADICWFEWCDELITYGSKHRLANERRIICRIHSYEAFTNYPLGVNWEIVDNIIFISNSIKDVVCSKVKIHEDNLKTIPNGINTDRYGFKNRNEGFNIAYVGYINYKKGPMLLLHTFKAIVDKDPRYKLYIAGQFQDERDVLYFEQMIKELKLDNNIFYQGWQQDLNNWLEDKNYILCTSVLESQNISVMQAMAKGIRPIIHNFVGAKSIYNNKYVWNTIEEAVNMIMNGGYNSIEYRNFIMDKYSLNKQLESIKSLLRI